MDTLGLVLNAAGINMISDKLLYYQPRTTKEFIYKQNLNSEQIISIAESYNRNLYEQIKNK